MDTRKRKMDIKKLKIDLRERKINFVKMCHLIFFA